MSDNKIPTLSPEFKEAWERANRFNNKTCCEDRAKLLADISRENVYALLIEKELTIQEIQNNELFCSVTEKVNSTKKPGRFVRPSAFENIQLNGGGIEDLYPVENINPGLVGITVDYLTRLITGDTADEAFHISLMGADIIKAKDQAESLLKTVNDLGDNSICAAIRLAGFDVIYRAGKSAYKPIDEICPDARTIENIRNMVERSFDFFNSYGPKIADHLTFKGGYTGHITSGDGDFLTKDTLWDFKVSKQKLSSKQVLQLLIYWRLGLHSIHLEYQNVKYLGVYNPRMNIVYRYPVDRISEKAIEEIDYSIICYPRE